MLKVLLNFKIQNPFVLNKFRIYDLGKNINFINEEITRDLINKRIKNLLKFIDFIERFNKSLNSEFKDYFKFSISIPGRTLELLEELKGDSNIEIETLLKKLNSILLNNNIELLAKPYYNSSAFIFSKTEISKQIRLNNTYFLNKFNPFNSINNYNNLSNSKDIISEKIKFLDLSNFFYLDFGKNKTKDSIQDLNLNKNLDFNPLFNSSNEFKNFLKELELEGVYYPNIILNSNLDFIKEIINNSNDGFEIEKEENKIMEFFSNNSYIINNLNLSLVQINLFSLEELDDSTLNGFKKLFEILIKNKNLISTNELVENKLNDQLTNEILKRIINNKIKFNRIQKEILIRLKILEPKIKNLNRNDLIEDWRLLTNLNFINAMKIEEHNISEIHRKNPLNDLIINEIYLSPYECFLNYINSIEDLEARYNKIANRMDFQKSILKDSNKKISLNELKEAINH